jgi:hypothetical protein
LTHICRNYGDPDAPDCKRVADPQYTMDFTDVEPGPNGYLYWCAKCGPIEKAMHDAIFEMAEADPSFVERFEAAVTEAEAEQRAGAH